jgi:hypothetical protein
MEALTLTKCLKRKIRKYMSTNESKIGKAGSGSKVHIVSVFVRPSDGLVIESIFCGAQQFNGSGNGKLNRTSEFDIQKVTCKRCLKKLS